MQISSPFNRFYHSAVLTELFRKANTLKFEGWIDANTGRPLIWERGENYNDMEDLKDLLKNMNLDYEVDGDKKTSTRDIDSKSLMQHIEFIIKLAALNSIEFDFIEREWEKLMNDAGIKRY